MKILVTGGKDLKDAKFITDKLNRILGNLIENTDVEIVNANNLGCDKRVKRFAIENGLDYTQFFIDWENDPVYARVDTNLKMVEYCDKAVLFDNGSDQSIKEILAIARVKGIDIRVVKYQRQRFGNEKKPEPELLSRIAACEQAGYEKFTGQSKGEAIAYLKTYGRMFK